MELEYLKVANNPIMWISVLPGVLLVIVQAIVLSRRAIVSGRKMGITERQFKSAIRSSALASIGPSLIIVTGMIALSSRIGGGCGSAKGQSFRVVAVPRRALFPAIIG